MRRTLTIIIALLSFSTLAFSATITDIDWSVLVTEDAPVGGYVTYETYHTTIYTDDAHLLSNGDIAWKEKDTQAPGISFVNVDDVDGSNCVMTAGYNPLDFSIKQCTDDLKTSKRFKLHATAAGQPVDLTFFLAPSGGPTTYRMLQKYSNYTGERLTGFTIQLGYLDPATGEFTASVSGDGLGYSSADGVVTDAPLTNYQTKEYDLSALWPQGLFGTADKYHPEPGYFDPYSRGFIELIQTEDLIETAATTDNYLSRFGTWNNIEVVKWGMFLDDDQDINTDNMLIGNCNGDFDPIAMVCNGVWEQYVNGVPYAATAETLAAWAADPYIFPLAIEDLSNLNLNYNVTIDDTWAHESFTVRAIPTADTGIVIVPEEPVAESCDNGMDDDADGFVDCADPDCDGVGLCGLEGRYSTCSDGFDNDGDGLVDCFDTSCSRNKSCR